MPSIDELDQVYDKLLATYKVLYEKPEPPKKGFWKAFFDMDWLPPSPMCSFMDSYISFPEYKMLAQLGDLSRGIEAMRNGLSPGAEAIMAYEEYAS